MEGKRIIGSTKLVFFTLVLLTVLTFPCASRPQMVKCLVQSYYRQTQGNGVVGKGTLLKAQLDSKQLQTPVNVEFTGTCNDSIMLTEFCILKERVKGSVVYIFRWSANTNYTLARRRNLLKLERVHKLTRHHKFESNCATNDCSYMTLKGVFTTGPPQYIMTDENGTSLIGPQPSDTTRMWFNIFKPESCSP